MCSPSSRQACRAERETRRNAMREPACFHVVLVRHARLHAGPNHRSVPPACHVVPLSPPSSSPPSAALTLSGVQRQHVRRSRPPRATSSVWSTAGTLTVATEGTYRPFSFHDETRRARRLRRRDRRGRRRQARPRGLVPGDAVGCDLRRARGRPLRRHRQPGLDQPRARGEVPLQRAVHRLARRHRRARGRRLDLELRRPRRQDDRAVAHEQLVRARAGERRDRRGGRGLGAGRRAAASRAASTPRSTTSSPSSTTRRPTVRPA